MTRLRFIGTILSVLIAHPAQAHGIMGSEAAAQPRSAACTIGAGPNKSHEPMWACGAREGYVGGKNAFSRKVDAPHGYGGGKTHDDWPANMILG